MPRHICNPLRIRRFETLVLLSWLWQWNRFPYNEQNTNQWFSGNIPDKPGQQINTLNVSLNEEEREDWQRWQNIVEEGARLPNFDGTPFFHGTNHNFALSILKGINIECGQEKCDFSDREGFYITNNFSESILYAHAKSRGSDRNVNLGGAVVIYDVDKEELNQKFQRLNLYNNLDSWRKVVREYRQLTPGQINIDFREELQTKDFIEGPCFKEFKDGKCQQDPSDKGQLCIRSNKCAEYFDQKIHSVIFFEK